MGGGYFVPACVQNMPLTFLVDNGSNVTILQRNLLDDLPLDTLLSLAPVNIKLVTATGNALHFMEKQRLKLY